MKKFLLATLIALTGTAAFTQGPPITLDKPIMLGARKGTARLYFKHQESEAQRFDALVAEADYNFSNSIAAGVELPIILGSTGPNRLSGDIAAMLKFQFLRKDGMGKTLRIAAKAKQSLATGAPVEVPVLGMGHAMTYGGILAAYESLRLGVQAEAGYALMYGGPHLNHLNYKLGFGLPLRKPRYPVNQVTVYLESEGIHFPEHHDVAQYGLYTAPGIQYARGKFTFDLSVQLPLAQQLQPSLNRQWTGLLGSRVIL